MKLSARLDARKKRVERMKAARVIKGQMKWTKKAIANVGVRVRTVAEPVEELAYEVTKPVVVGIETGLEAPKEILEALEKKVKKIKKVRKKNRAKKKPGKKKKMKAKKKPGRKTKKKKKR